jgi:hypothetical protein
MGDEIRIEGLKVALSPAVSSFMDVIRSKINTAASRLCPADGKRMVECTHLFSAMPRIFLSGQGCINFKAESMLLTSGPMEV